MKFRQLMALLILAPSLLLATNEQQVVINVDKLVEQDHLQLNWDKYPLIFSFENDDGYVEETVEVSLPDEPFLVIRSLAQFSYYTVTDDEGMSFHISASPVLCDKQDNCIVSTSEASWIEEGEFTRVKIITTQKWKYLLKTKSSSKFYYRSESSAAYSLADRFDALMMDSYKSETFFKSFRVLNP